MIVIEGKSQKSLIVDALISGASKGSYILLNAVDGYNPITNWELDFRKCSHETIISWLESSLGKYITTETLLFILEVNSPKELLSKYSDVVKKYEFEQCVITVQNNALDQNIIYLYQ